MDGLNGLCCTVLVALCWTSHWNFHVVSLKGEFNLKITIMSSTISLNLQHHASEIKPLAKMLSSLKKALPEVFVFSVSNSTATI